MCPLVRCNYEGMYPVKEHSKNRYISEELFHKMGKF